MTLLGLGMAVPGFVQLPLQNVDFAFELNVNIMSRQDALTFFTTMA